MNENYGRLNQVPIELHRKYFEEMVNLRGVFCQYRYPAEDKQYTTQGELFTGYIGPKKVGCIFNEHLDQKTTKLLGWNSERDTDATVISVPYNLEGLQVGALFEIPSAFDNAPSRLFRVIDMSTIALYPASVTCRLVPEYETNVSQAATQVFTNSDFNLLNQEDEEHYRWEY